MCRFRLSDGIQPDGSFRAVDEDVRDGSAARGLTKRGPVCHLLTANDMGPVTCPYPQVNDHKACPDRVVLELIKQATRR